MGILEILLSNEIETNMNNLLVTYHEALDMIEARTGALPPRTLNWREAQGMTRGRCSRPRTLSPFANSAMDGYAVRGGYLRRLTGFTRCIAGAGGNLCRKPTPKSTPSGICHTDVAGARA